MFVRLSCCENRLRKSNTAGKILYFLLNRITEGIPG